MSVCCQYLLLHLLNLIVKEKKSVSSFVQLCCYFIIWSELITWLCHHNSWSLNVWFTGSFEFVGAPGTTALRYFSFLYPCQVTVPPCGQTTKQDCCKWNRSVVHIQMYNLDKELILSERTKHHLFTCRTSDENHFVFTHRTFFFQQKNNKTKKVFLHFLLLSNFYY